MFICCAVTEGEARVAANVTRLQFVRNVSLTDCPRVYGMYALSADELLLVCGAAGLHAVSLRTGLFAAAKSSAIRDVYGVAFDTHTDTVLLVVETPTDDYQQLVSLRRNASEWLEVQRLDTRIHRYIPSISVCDSRVLLGDLQGMQTLYVFDVNEAHNLIVSDAGNVSLESVFNGFACTRRGNDTLVAFAHDSSVSLWRLAALPLRLEPLASVNITDPWQLLFRGDLLLVDDWSSATRTNDIVSFRVAENALSERRVLLNSQEAGFDFGRWALLGERIVLSAWNDARLLVYDFI